MKNEYVTIETAEQLKIQYRMASPLARFVAFLLDYIFFYLFVLLVTFLLIFILKYNYIGKMFDSSLSYSAILAFYFIFLFLLKWGYFIFFEFILNGKTPGKLITRIRVINFSGAHLEISSVVIRNFLRVIDQDITFFMGALIALLFSKNFQRIGDVVAGTVVIQDESLPRRIPSFSLDFNYSDSHNFILTIDNLSEYELYGILRFLNTLEKFNKKKRLKLGNRIAEYLKLKLSDESKISNHFEYIKSIYLKYYHGN